MCVYALGVCVCMYALCVLCVCCEYLCMLCMYAQHICVCVCVCVCMRITTYGCLGVKICVVRYSLDQCVDIVVYCGVCVCVCVCVLWLFVCKNQLKCTVKYTLDLWVWVGQGTFWM